MAEITIKVSDEERKKLAAAVEELNKISHVRYMSRTMLANTAGIKETKVRAVLQEMIDRGELTQYAATQNEKLQRYYYVLTDAGRTLLQQETQ